LIIWPPPGAEPVDVTGLYERFAAAGHHYGPAFQGIRAAWRHGDEILAELALDERRHADVPGHVLHPALLDAALQTAALLPGRDAAALLPFSWTDVTARATGATTLRTRLTANGPEAVTLTAYDLTGQEVLSAGSLALRPLTTDGLRPTAPGPDGLHRLEWVPVPVPENAESTGTEWGVLGAPLRDAATGALSWPGLDALRAAPDRSVPPLVLAECPRSAGQPEHGTDRPGTDQPGMDQPGTDRPEDEAGRLRITTADCLALIQAWLAEEQQTGSTLVLLTHGAVSTGPGDRVADWTQSGVWGLLRSAQTEHPGRFALVDVDGHAASLNALSAALPLALAAGDHQLAVRAGEALVPRLMSGPPRDTLAPPPTQRPMNHPMEEPGKQPRKEFREKFREEPGKSPESEPGERERAAWRIDRSGPGSVAGLTAVPAPAALAPLADGQVRVAVRAAGLNFHDVVASLGLDPDHPSIGSEGAGVVVETGPGVADLAPGDRVMGVFGGAFGPTAVADRRTLARIPQGWSFAQAASVPIAFLTASYALFDLGGLRRGQSVLVHAAAGGVGMAAVQLARHTGAEVFGTASPEKWDALRSGGLDDAHLASSRTTEFADRFLDTTGGRGVDLVLDSLAREFVDASLELLPRGGRFVEMGKTDIRDAAEVARDHPGVHYRAFDLMEAGPDRIGALLTDVLDLFERGVLTPSPLTCWDIRHAPRAFRRLARARHIGKNVLTVPAPLDPDGTVLVTGGTGTLGGLVARHLATVHGVRHLLLTARRTPADDTLVRELADAGAHATVVACDVTDRTALSRLLADIDPEHPLTAVVHAAGALDDGVLTSLTPERLDRVLRPKADAALALHELTRDTDLAAFVLFSSGAALLGTAGQAGYAAANAALDALAARRRAEGLPAVSIAWGLWEERSALTARLVDADLDRTARGGFGALTTAEALTLFDAALRTEQSHVLAAKIDTVALGAARRAGAPLPALLGHLGRAPRRAPATPAAPVGPAFADRLAALSPTEAQGALLDLVRGHAAAVLGHSSARLIGAGRPFKELGFDSLTGVELRNRLAATTGERLPAALVFDHPTPETLARYLAGRLLT
ncbi:SDR family NAD(P)-dependent oxidoreductase, partial [Streptomyces clavuligerus]